MNKNNQKNNQEKSLTSVGINWYIPTLVNYLQNAYK